MSSSKLTHYVHTKTHMIFINDGVIRRTMSPAASDHRSFSTLRHWLCHICTQWEASIPIMLIEHKTPISVTNVLKLSSTYHSKETKQNFILYILLRQLECYTEKFCTLSVVSPEMQAWNIQQTNSCVLFLFYNPSFFVVGGFFFTSCLLSHLFRSHFLPSFWKK